jgi:hypothetical protein
MHIFLTLALVGGEWSASRPGCFTPGTHWIGSWVDPRASLDDMEKILDPTRTPNSAVQPVASHYTDCAILALDLNIEPEENLNGANFKSQH